MISPAFAHGKGAVRKPEVPVVLLVAYDCRLVFGSAVQLCTCIWFDAT